MNINILKRGGSMDRLKFQNWPFMVKTLCCMLSIVLVTLVGTLAFLMPHVQTIVEDNYNSSMNMMLDTMQQNIEYSLERYERMAYMITGNDELNRYILHPETGDVLPHQKEISDFLSSYIISDSHINSVVIHCNDGRIYSCMHYSENGIAHLASLAAEYAQEQTTGRFAWYYDNTFLPVPFSANRNERILLLGTIKNRTDVYKNEVIASFAIEYDMSMLERHYEKFNANSYRYVEVWDEAAGEVRILQKRGETPDEQLAQIVRGLARRDANPDAEWNRSNYYARSIQNANWILLGVADNTEVKLISQEVRGYLYMVLLAEVSIALLVSLLLAYQISKPLKQMTSHMKQVEGGELNVRIPVERHDEFGYLALNFNYMMERLNNLIHEMYEVKASEKDAQILAMRMQMNPHFLYNTLDAINWCVNLGETEDACRMIACLGDILRYNVKGSDLVTMQDEVEQSVNYLCIQQIRMGDILSYRVDINEDIMKCKVMKFFLQPIVENAVLHGISGCGHSGEVVISAQLDEDDLLVCVSDNGNGIPTDQIPLILGGAPKDGSHRGGIGVSNVHKRIRLSAVHERFGVSIESNGNGTRIWIRLPLLL